MGTHTKAASPPGTAPSPDGAAANRSGCFIFQKILRRTPFIRPSASLRLRLKSSPASTAGHHNVYVILLDAKVADHPSIRRLNPKRDPAKPCVYVGMTGLPVEHRFENHKHGYKSAWT